MFLRSLRGNGRMSAGLFHTILFGIISSMGFYLVAWRNVDMSRDRLVAEDGRGEVFDFIVVGAGSAGALIANRLSKNFTVLLLEAGGEMHPFQTIPSFALFLLNYPQIDWQYSTVPQQHGFFAQNHQECLLNAGLGLGGTSGINFMMHNRGHPRDYDEWAKLLNDPQYSYDALLPYFKRGENFVGKYPAGELGDFHGRHGEMTVQVPDFTGLGDVYLDAARERGFNVTDLNGKFTEGFDLVYSPLQFGARQSSYDAFLKPIQFRNNLLIRKYSLVTKVLFKENNTDNEAYGVEYIRHGKKKVAYANREIVLSAGAMNSPKILMQSGIGPKDNLDAVKIDVRKELPVGKNLQDHTAVYLGPFFINDTLSVDVDKDFTLGEFYKFLTLGTGKFASTGINAQGFISSSMAKTAGEGDWPDIHMSILGASICSVCDRQIARGFNFKEDVLQAYYGHAKGKNSFMQLISNGRPHSRGRMYLRSSNPKVPPVIDPSYLDNEHDVKVMVEGIKAAVEMVENTTVFQQIGGRFTDERFPGCQEEEFRSDAYWECFVRQYTVSFHHLSGTCSMGKDESSGVVDTSMRVFGTKRLRVIDASVMPMVPVGNTNWPTMMLGEKGAETILSFWENPQESATETEFSVREESEPETVQNDVIVDFDLRKSAQS